MTLFSLLFLTFLTNILNGLEVWNLEESEWRELESLITGSVILPTDTDYASSYVLWAATFDNVYPEAIVVALTKYDVSTIWKWLLTKTDDISNKLVTLRTCCHSFGGWSTTYGLIIDVKNIQTLEIADDEVLNNGVTVKTAYVGPGVNLAMFTAWAEENDVTLPHGDCASVCFGGFLLGGGFGVTSRTFGLGVDWIQSMDVVLVDSGELVTISADNEYSDLFWAMKGAGQSQYAILTEYFMRIPWKQQVEPGLYISLEWEYTEDNWNTISNVWSSYVTNTDYGNHFAIYIRIQPENTLGNDYYITFHGFWTGEQSDGLTMLSNLYNDISITPTTSKIEYDHFEGWISPSDPNRYRYSSLCKSRFKVDTTELDDELFTGMYNQVDKLANYEVGPNQNASDNYNYPTTFMFLAPAGGAIKHHTTEDSSFNWRDAEYLYVVCVRWTPSNDIAYNYGRTWLKETMDLLEPYLSETSSFVNFPDNTLTNALDMYYGDSLDKLTIIKEKYNPNNIFQHPQSISIIQNDNNETNEKFMNTQWAIYPRDPNQITLYDEYLNTQLTLDSSTFPLDKTVAKIKKKNCCKNKKTESVEHVKQLVEQTIKYGDKKKLNQFKEKYHLDKQNEMINQNTRMTKNNRLAKWIAVIGFVAVCVILVVVIGYKNYGKSMKNNNRYDQLSQSEYVAIGQESYSTF